jgi:two-component system NtrC family sensor kinase
MPADASAVTGGVGDARHAEDASSDHLSVPVENRRILVIDDNPAVHEDICKILASAKASLSRLRTLETELFEEAPRPVIDLPFEIESAYQGADGLGMVERARAEGRPYALAFVDVRMPPGWDGIETTARLMKEDPELQTVICSAFSDHSWSDIMLRLAPADGLLILRKPFDALEIRQLSYALTTKWALRRTSERQLEHLEARVSQRTRDLLAANEELRRQSEERARMEVELRLAHKLEAVGQLAAGIAHELNTPIQFLADSVHFLHTGSQDVQGVLELQREIIRELASGRPDLIARLEQAEEAADFEFLRKEVPRAFERVFEGTRRVTTIVRALKEFAHPDRREKMAADLNQALQSTLVVAGNEYKYIAEVETELGPIPPVLCHVGDLNQVFLNLIVNAAHAMEAVVKSAGQLGRIRISTAQEGAEVVIKIADTGCGIPPEIATRVFDPFFTTKEVGKGTGQGLAIARSIVVDKHQGTITFDSQVGRGTCFTIRLPVGGGQPGATTEQA